MASVDVHNISISSFPSSLSLAATTSVVISKLRVCVCVRSCLHVCLLVCWFIRSVCLFVCLLVFRMRVHNEKVSSSIRRKHSEDRGG